jgi:hypothetical protein
MLASSAIAATANIHLGGGTNPDQTPIPRAATPTQVSPGQTAGFYLWIRNDDPANLSSFFMKAFVDAGVTPLGAYWARNGESTKHGCTTSGGLMCSFGALNSGDVIRITAAFTLPTSTAANEDHCLPAGGAGYHPTAGETSFRCIHFQFGANSGFVELKGKNKSRGDAFHWYDYAATNTDSDDQKTSFPFCDLSTQTIATCAPEPLSIANDAASASNVQSTALTAPRGAFDSAHGTTGLSVADNFIFECPDAPLVTDCANHEGTGSNAFVGQWSDASVNSEQTFGTDFIHLTITMYGVNPNSIDGVVHLWQDASNVWHEEVIRDECPSSAGPAAGSTDPCFWASGSSHLAIVDIWAHNNGKWGNF